MDSSSRRSSRLHLFVGCWLASRARKELTNCVWIAAKVDVSHRFLVKPNPRGSLRCGRFEEPASCREGVVWRRRVLV